MSNFTLSMLVDDVGQCMAATKIGVTQGAVSQMLRSRRDIRVVTDADGRIATDADGFIKVYEIKQLGRAAQA